jgi:hypothetical protein
MAEAPSREAGRGGATANTQQASWRREAESIKTELTKLLDLNRAYFTARGPKAAEEGKSLETALDTFQRDRIPALEDLRAQIEDAALSRSYAAFAAQIRKFIGDLRAKDLSSSKLEDLLEQYKLAVLP